MKYLKYIIISCLITGMFTSCELDYSPEDWYGSSTFWQNEAQVDGLWWGCTSIYVILTSIFS